MSIQMSSLQNDSDGEDDESIQTFSQNILRNSFAPED